MDPDNILQCGLRRHVPVQPGGVSHSRNPRIPCHHDEFFMNKTSLNHRLFEDTMGKMITVDNNRSIVVKWWNVSGKLATCRLATLEIIFFLLPAGLPLLSHLRNNHPNHKSFTSAKKVTCFRESLSGRRIVQQNYQIAIHLYSQNLLKRVLILNIPLLIMMYCHGGKIKESQNKQI